MLISTSLVVVSMFATVANAEDNRQFSYPNWLLNYPSGAYMGLFLAAALPLEVQHKNVFMAFNWEANYFLPTSDTENFEYPPIVQTGVNRKLIYDSLKNHIEGYGYPGMSCLLRLICETSVSSLALENGLLGDILHILFTPSTSKNVKMTSKYRLAENYGKTHGNCERYSQNCTVSFLDWITWLDIPQREGNNTL